MAKTKAERSAAAKKAAETRKKNQAAEKRGKAARASKPQVEVDSTGQSAEGLSEYSPKHSPLQAAGLDQQVAHEEREAERAAEREKHNERTDAGRVERQGWNH